MISPVSLAVVAGLSFGFLSSVGSSLRICEIMQNPQSQTSLRSNAKSSVAD